MPIDLAQLRARRATAVVEYHGVSLTVTFRPEQFDAEAQAKMLAVGRTAEFRPLVELLLALLTEWDLTDDAQPVPITAESLAALPIGLLTEVARSVTTEAIGMDPSTPVATTSTSPSSNGSPPAATSVAPTGPTAFPIGSA